ncbi:MAK10-like protein [Tanacetum coccineum]|uniref:MAK10-like protein n=1 Tax=Tanacetum coccineum TaxID=301880 RepID=A0ABQ4Y945_9ASTR
MGDENLIRTLGDYSNASHEGYRNTIELPKGNDVVPLRSDTIRLVQNGCSFHGLRSEDPNQHLKDFLKLVDSLDLDVANRERTRLRLFQFSLRDKASNWLERLPARSISTWEDLTTRFLVQFFLPGRTAKLRNDILMFRQHQKECLSEAWTPGGKLRDRNAEESWALLDDLALYDNESWNDPRDFAKPVKEISSPQDVPMNKISSSCEICSGPHDTQYCRENLEQAFVNYASSRNDEVGEGSVKPNAAEYKDHKRAIEVKEEVEKELKEESTKETEEETEEEEEDDPKYFNTFPIINELRYHEWILKNLDPYGLNYYRIISEGLKSRRKTLNPKKVSNLVGRIKGLKVMVRTVQQQQQENDYEDDDGDYISTTTASHNKDGKASSHRSKHSETEQRRRSKINERFQHLRDLIPQNDQKTDRASFLLEVIQYIHFLQEKLQAYEGTCQGWIFRAELEGCTYHQQDEGRATEMVWIGYHTQCRFKEELDVYLGSALGVYIIFIVHQSKEKKNKKGKRTRGNYGADNYPDQLQPARNGSVYESNVIPTSLLLTNGHNLVEPDVSGSTAFRTTDQNTYVAEPSHNPQGSFPDVELLASQSRPPTWNAGQSCAPSELEESSISNAYSKGMLNNITQALGSSGVDLSQASISVQFDIKKGTSSGATSTPLRFQDHNLSSSRNQTIRHCAVRSRDDVSDQVHKKPRTKQNQ